MYPNKKDREIRKKFLLTMKQMLNEQPKIKDNIILKESYDRNMLMIDKEILVLQLLDEMEKLVVEHKNKGGLN